MRTAPIGGLASLTGWRADLAALAAGIVSAAALPPVCAIPVLLVGIPVLLHLIQTAGSGVGAFRRGFWFGFGLNLIGLYWITEAILIEAARFWWFVPLAVPGLSAVMALFIAVPATLAWRVPPGWRQVFTLAGAWVLADIARQFIGSGFPWNPLGSVWEMPGRPGDIMIQLASLVGVHGLTLITLLLAALPVLGWGWRILGVIGLGLWVGFGIQRLDEPMPQPLDLTVLLIQGNVEQGQKWNQTLMAEIFDRYLDLTQKAVASLHGHPGIVVWPETASPAQLATDQAAREAISDADNNMPALIGSVRWDRNRRPRNSLFALGASGTIDGVYDKAHLVPFGEYQPNWLPGIQIVPGGGFAPGPGPRTLHIPGVPPVGPLICYEAIFSHQIVDESDRPEWLVNVTNDAWFGNSTGPRQHLAAARLRAVEEGLPLLRAANTGISAGFDARGHELARLGMQNTGSLAISLPPALPATFYARTGLILPLVLASITLIAGISIRTTNRGKRRTNF